MEGRRVSSGKAEKEAEVRFLGLPGGNLQKYIDNYMLLHLDESNQQYLTGAATYKEDSDGL